ncbi:hypothetical protein Y032_0088g2164 [Ancylostoma ceylanicum]|uniref:Uncharacterized protein n=2 Tax=Ancylostoma ceylanicum TaxID=53326 RepID=A0A016TPG7_9BILA|nr:hypothetical protein Y032_0088g2164 [Ancylostoma ceylanicum]
MYMVETIPHRILRNFAQCLFYFVYLGYNIRKYSLRNLKFHILKEGSRLRNLLPYKRELNNDSSRCEDVLVFFFFESVGNDWYLALPPRSTYDCRKKLMKRIRKHTVRVKRNVGYGAILPIK